MLLQPRAERQSVHHGHHHVRHDNVGHALHGKLQSALSVSRLYNVIAVEQQRAQISTHIGVVVHDEHGGKFVRIVIYKRVVPAFLHRLHTCQNLLFCDSGGVVYDVAVLTTELQDVPHYALQLLHIALYDADELPCVALSFSKLTHWSGYERQRSAQLV